MNYKYYIYIRPGEIYYFDDYEKAVEKAEFYDVEVQEVK